MRRAPVTLDERGFTLIEMLVTVAIIGLILAPVLTILTQGTRTEATTSKQFSQQEQAYKVFRQIVDGVSKRTALVPGLLQARALNTGGGLAFQVENTIVTYYSADGSLYRKTCDTGTPGCAVSPIDPTGGTAILPNVQQFAATQAGQLVTLQLEVHSPARTTGGSDTGIRLVTEVVVRNLP